jgi:hypothetical protein
MHKYAIIGLLALVATLAACTDNPANPNFVPEQCKVDIIDGQPYQRPGHEDCIIASDGSGRIVLRG